MGGAGVGDGKEGLLQPWLEELPGVRCSLGVREMFLDSGLSWLMENCLMVNA